MMPGLDNYLTACENPDPVCRLCRTRHAADIDCQAPPVDVIIRKRREKENGAYIFKQ